MSEQAEAKKRSKRSFSVKNFYRLQLSFRRRKVFFSENRSKVFFPRKRRKKSFVVISFPFVAHRENCSRKIVGGELYLLIINIAL